MLTLEGLRHGPIGPKIGPWWYWLQAQPGGILSPCSSPCETSPRKFFYCQFWPGLGRWLSLPSSCSAGVCGSRFSVSGSYFGSWVDVPWRSGGPQRFSW